MPKPGRCVVVILGVGGDLAQRKLLPALFHLFLDGGMPDEFAIIGVERGDATHRRGISRRRSRDAVAAEVSPAQLQNGWVEFGRRLHYVAGDFARCRRVRQVEAMYRRHQRHDSRPARAPVSSRASAQPLSGGHSSAGQLRIAAEDARSRRAPMGAGGDREAVRSRRSERAGAAARRPAGDGRAPALSHRSLSRQGDRAEPAGAAVCQFDLRDGLEPALRRARADHRQRDARRGAPRQVLRGSRHRPRHVPESSLAVAHAHRDGAADGVWRRPGARRKGQGAARDSSDATRPLPCGGSTARAGRWARGAGLSPGGAGRAPIRRRRRMPPCGSRSTTGGGRACRSSCVPASGWRPAGPRSRSGSGGRR